jgi:hypothetical protein
MTWKNVIRKNELNRAVNEFTPRTANRDMTFQGTAYADDNGDSITFYGHSRTKQATVPKHELNRAIDRYDADTGRETKRLTQITMSAGPAGEFTEWAMKNGYK